MNAHSKYRSLLRSFEGRVSFSAADAEEAGIPRHALSYFVRRGELERICRGYYRLATEEVEDLVLEGLVLTASTVPNGVVCLVSALSYHELTDEIPRVYWIAIPKSQWVSKRPHARIVRMQDTSTGAMQVSIGGEDIAMFDRERCIVDAFRYLGEEVGIKALRAYLFEHGQRPDIPKLLEFARKLRVDLNPFLKALST